MARVTLGDIIRRGHLMADVPEPSTGRTDAFADEPEIIDVANEGLSGLHDILVEKYEDFLTTDATIKLQQGIKTTVLPSDFFRFKDLFLIVGGNQRVRLEPFDLHEQNCVTTTETAEYPCYRLMSNKLFWDRPPSADRQAELWYTRQFKPLVNRTDEISPEIPFGWEQFPIAHVAEYLLNKEERDPAPALMAKERARQRIIKAASNREASRPRMTPEVTGRFTRKRRFPIPMA